jgi:hypothetical protein
MVGSEVLVYDLACALATIVHDLACALLALFLFVLSSLAVPMQSFLVGELYLVLSICCSITWESHISLHRDTLCIGAMAIGFAFVSLLAYSSFQHARHQNSMLAAFSMVAYFTSWLMVSPPHFCRRRSYTFL